ncbi:MAG TPA: type 1 glutamine amidotransferase [Euzebyales bacterium]|nr:type 1 glutamine amidotransferase [Euzebyales bacterium]
MIVTVLQHGPWGGPGVVGRQLVARGHELDVRRVYADDEVPEDPPDALVVLGGQMCTDEQDRHPFLAAELALLAKCVASDTPTLGICLGAQLLAEATGGSVRHGTPEIGYARVRLTAAGREDPVLSTFVDGTPTFNAHRDFITAGPDAVVLARSDRSPVHAMRVGQRVYGIQFHPEMGAAQVARYANADQPGEYLRSHGWKPADLIALAEQHDADHERMGRELTDRWLDHVAPFA